KSRGDGFRRYLGHGGGRVQGAVPVPKRDDRRVPVRAGTLGVQGYGKNVRHGLPGPDSRPMQPELRPPACHGPARAIRWDHLWGLPYEQTALEHPALEPFAAPIGRGADRTFLWLGGGGPDQKATGTIGKYITAHGREHGILY